MAGWITHLRLAEALMAELSAAEAIDEEFYYAGSLAPDCGRRIEYSGQKARYVPGREHTHWVDDNGEWDAPIHFERFYDQYLRPKGAGSLRQRAFYWGYYVHLLTDALWIELGMRAFIEPGNEWSRALRQQTRQAALVWEQDFYRAHPDYAPLRKLEQIQALDFDPMGLKEAWILERLRGIRPAYEDIKPQTERMAPEKYDQILSRMICLSYMILRAQ